MKLLIYEDWKNSASSRDNFTFQQEVKIQSECYQIARDFEILLKNSEQSTFNQYFQKALSIFHRFAHQVSYKKFNRHIYMAACLFLSAKDNDMFDWSVKRYSTAFISHCLSKKALDIDGLKIEVDDSSTQKMISDKIIDAESHILQMIGYDLHIIVPQVYFQEAKTKLVAAQGDIQQLFEFAQKFLSDLFLNNACLYYEPKIITLCAITMASKLLKITIADLPNGEPWHSLFDQNLEVNAQTQKEILEMTNYFDQCIQILKS
ncbi:unnamed protein product [Paramecium octaurelia]|uniref:Cyclin N-terminal domain-containing protein n=1 Tax=Paramecium octaurelia TaxID=43137 RepID=A0A8S1XM21_PAROT|nr:unnamed protein product [Paramecium octaurelia]